MRLSSYELYVYVKKRTHRTPIRISVPKWDRSSEVPEPKQKDCVSTNRPPYGIEAPQTVDEIPFFSSFRE
ncbi:MAG: hypothetical protein CSA35_01605 [Dethiosulfovibrio peptidovorans]|nr:MAG: hypothetical protein CSA35_01605 [Dethiosulfovibrio peptidovorans]